MQNLLGNLTPLILHTLMFRGVLYSTLLSIFAVLALAGVSPGFPFNDQYPQIPVAGMPYKFIISDSTIVSSSNAATNYSISGNPSWLEFDSSSLLLSGTPPSGTSTSISFNLTGEDENGDSASISCSLPVTTQDAPQLYSSDAIISQLAHFGQTNGVDGLVLTPGDKFSVSFAADKTFKSSSPLKAYYGLSANRTSLPAWVQFSADGNNLTFSGTAPAVNSKIAPSVEYTFDLIASYLENFSGLVANFKLVIGAHQLSTTIKSPIIINPTNNHFNQSVPLDQVFLDGSRILLANISSISVQEPLDWIKVDNASISGTAPNNSTTSFNVNIYDQFGDAVSIPFQIQPVNFASNSSSSSSSSSNSTAADLFAVSSIENVNASFSQYFQYTLSDSIFLSQNTNATAAFQSTWLKYHGENFTFNGNTPASFGDILVTLTASRAGLSKRDNNQLQFTIAGISTAAKKDSGMSKNKKLAIILGTVIPVVVLVVLAVIAAALFKRRSSGEQDVESKKQISNPILDNPINKGQLAGPLTGPLAAPLAAAADEQTLSSVEEDDAKDTSNETKYVEKQEFRKSTGIWQDPTHTENWKLVRDDSEIKLEMAHSIHSIHSSDTEVEFGEHFNSDSDAHNPPTYQESIHSQYVDTQEYLAPRDGQLLSSENLLDAPNNLSGSNIARHNLLPTTAEDQRKSVTIPRKSWRHVVDSTRQRFSGARRQESINSLATVSTDELFSVRLVDDKVSKTVNPEELRHQSVTSSKYDKEWEPLEEIANVQRLDSRGNILYSPESSEYDSNRSSVNSSSSSDSKRKLKITIPNLDVLQEENSPQIGTDAITEEQDPNFSTEIGRNQDTLPSYYNITTRSGLSYSEQARAQKASHSRKRNISQTYSSSSDSNKQKSMHSSSNSKSTASKSPSPFKAQHITEDSFTFDAGNSLPIIYSPDVTAEDQALDATHPYTNVDTRHKRSYGSMGNSDNSQSSS